MYFLCCLKSPGDYMRQAFIQGGLLLGVYKLRTGPDQRTVIDLRARSEADHDVMPICQLFCFCTKIKITPCN